MRLYALLVSVLTIVTCGTAPGVAWAAPLQGAQGLARAYAAILDADFEGASRLIDEACPPAPAEACLTLEATRLLWRIQLDPEQLRLDPSFTEAVDRAISATEAWVAREPASAEPWFYAGGAYGARVQWRVLRRQHVAAARDGKRIKTMLDRAVRLDPSLADAQFGLGLYEYYADVAPAAARVLRFLLLLPSGNRARGLARMRDARERGALLADEAAFQLHRAALWYENQPQEGVEILRDLSERHPHNPLFHRLIAEALDVYLHDVSASLDGFRHLLALAESHSVHEPALAEAEARLGIAAALDAMGDTDRAVTELTTLLAREPSEPWAASARARLALALAFDRLGDWSKAEALLEEIVARPPAPDPLGLRAAARRKLQRPTAFTKGEAHRLAISAWRTFERTPSAPVEPLFEKALTFDPQNTIARYRYGRVLAAHDEPARALTALELVLRAPSTTPPLIVADAALEAGRLRERTDDVPRAVAHYQRAAFTFGASAQTREAATAALARLQGR
jgi:tetratricopeptide (TPR) repeat protein